MKKEKFLLRFLVAVVIFISGFIVFMLASGNGINVNVPPQTEGGVCKLPMPPETTTTTLPQTTTAAVTTTAENQTSTTASTPVSTTAPITAETTTQVITTMPEPTAPVVPVTPAEILARYTEVMDKAKAEGPAHKKVEFQAIPEDKVNFEGGVFDKILPIASNFFVTEEKARANPEIFEKGNDMYWFPPYRVKKGCMLTDVSKIKSASCTALADGNNKIVIVLNDETNSEPPAEGATSCDSAVGSMFSPVQRAEVVYTLENDKTVKFIIKDLNFDLVYYDCTAELVYNPQTNEIVSLYQRMNILIKINSGKVLVLNAVGTAVLENNLYLTDFVY